jgi:protein O-mannosyl-transferase
VVRQQTATISATGAIGQHQAAGTWTPWLLGIAILLATAICYLPAYRSGFVWDDKTLLTENPRVQAADGVMRIWRGTEDPDYFPLTYSSLWLEWRLWGMNPAGYHATNVLLHALAAVLLWRLLLRLRVPGAWWASMLFALHPVCVESVAWISERKNTLSLVLYLLALIAYLRSERGERRWYAVSIAAFALALLSKPSVVMLPVVLLLCAWWQRDRITRADLWRSLPFFGLSGAISFLTIWIVNHRAYGIASIAMGGPLDRLAQAGRAVWFYLYKAVAPVHLAAVYARWQTRAADVSAWIPLLALAFCFAVLWHYRKTWGRAPLFALAYFVISLVPVLGFFRMSYLEIASVADHFQYVAIAAVPALLAGVLMRGPSAPAPRVRWLRASVALAVVVLLGGLSWQQAHIFTDEETLWRATLAANPGAWLAHSNYAAVLARQGSAADAVEHYREALRIEPNARDALSGLAFLLATSPDPSIRNFPEAQLLAEKVCAITSYKIPQFLETLATVYSAQGRLREAQYYFEQAIAADEYYARAYVGLARALMMGQNFPRAEVLLEKSLGMDSLNPEALMLLAHIELVERKYGAAVRHARRARAVGQGQYAFGNFLAAKALQADNKPREAATQYELFLQEASDHPMAAEARAALAALTGQ